jgi:uncharacterized membrane protein
MNTKWTIILVTIFIAVGLLASALAYPSLPVQMASHWDATGEVNGYMPKLAAVLILPGLLILLLGLLMFMPLIDPLRANIAKFRPQYNLIIVFLGGFFLYLHILTLLWNLGHEIPIGGALAPAMGILFFGIGILLKSAKPNWTFGIRTPWTLSNPVVWDRTHALGSTVFKISGVLITLGVLLPEYGVLLLVAIVGLASLGLVVYSYLEYRKIEKGIS